MIEIYEKDNYAFCYGTKLIDIEYHFDKSNMCLRIKGKEVKSKYTVFNCYNKDTIKDVREYRALPEEIKIDLCKSLYSLIQKYEERYVINNAIKNELKKGENFFSPLNLLIN